MYFNPDTREYNRMNENNVDPILAIEERKRKRLETWRLKQQLQQQQLEAQNQPKPKVSISLSKAKHKSKSKSKSSTRILNFSNPLFSKEFEDDFEDDRNNINGPGKKRHLDLLQLDSLMKTNDSNILTSEGSSQQGRKRRWDNVGESSRVANASNTSNDSAPDVLDQFMEKLQAGASGVIQSTLGGDQLDVDVSGSFVRNTRTDVLPGVSGGHISAEELLTYQNLKMKASASKNESNEDPLYNPSDWLSDATDNEDDEKEEQGRRDFIEALKQEKPTNAPIQQLEEYDIEETSPRPAQLAAEVKSEKSRREEHLRELELEAEKARKSSQNNEPELGRYLYDDLESGVVEEAERNLVAAKAAPDALTVLAELNKKKEIQAVDHSLIEYMPFTKNLYRVPRALATLKHEDVIDRRAKLKVRVRGHGAPAPLQSFEQAGLSEAILSILLDQGINEPYPVQAQCIPSIMGTCYIYDQHQLIKELLYSLFVLFPSILKAGRDVIGIAKTGSGKTLAYLLPLLRHILVQPPLGVNESGPIGLILAPARELAFQIHSVCKSFAKHLGLK